MNSSPSIRLSAIRNAPLSWREKDILTGAEQHLQAVLTMDIRQMISPFYPDLSTAVQEKINLVWKFELAAYHLVRKGSTGEATALKQELKHQAAHIYELEAQRILGALFPLESNFWKAFYKRQEAATEKNLIAIDAFHFASTKQRPVVYQLLLQIFREIIKGHYADGVARSEHFHNATRLLGNLPLPELKQWLHHQATQL